MLWKQNHRSRCDSHSHLDELHTQRAAHPPTSKLLPLIQPTLPGGGSRAFLCAANGPLADGPGKRTQNSWHHCDFMRAARNPGEYSTHVPGYPKWTVLEGSPRLLGWLALEPAGLPFSLTVEELRRECETPGKPQPRQPALKGCLCAAPVSFS